MSSWSRRRRALYAAVVTILLVGAVIVPAFLYLYEAPTCFDGIRNGNEQGVDCGGSCERLCQSSFLPASVAWTRFEEVAPSLYNVGAYLINPNTQGLAANVPYIVTLYDDRGVPILTSEGSTTIPPQRNTLVFMGAVSVGRRVPAKALFEFLEPPQWVKASDPLEKLVIGQKKYVEELGGSSLIVDFQNAGLEPIPRFAVHVVLYDAEGNALGFSRTIVDGIEGRGSVSAPFTWPVDRDGKVVTIEVLPVVEVR